MQDAGEHTVTYEGGEAQDLREYVGMPKFVHLDVCAGGEYLGGVVSTGLMWDIGISPLTTSEILAETGLRLFDGIKREVHGAFYVAGVIEYRAAGKIGYVLRVREVPLSGEAPDVYEDFLRQYPAVSIGLFDYTHSVAFQLRTHLAASVPSPRTSV